MAWICIAREGANLISGRHNQLHKHRPACLFVIFAPSKRFKIHAAHTCVCDDGTQGIAPNRDGDGHVARRVGCKVYRWDDERVRAHAIAGQLSIGEKAQMKQWHGRPSPNAAAAGRRQHHRRVRRRAEVGLTAASARPRLERAKERGW